LDLAAYSVFGQDDTRFAHRLLIVKKFGNSSTLSIMNVRLEPFYVVAKPWRHEGVVVQMIVRGTGDQSAKRH
jgi:hypothetical protein